MRTIRRKPATASVKVEERSYLASLSAHSPLSICAPARPSAALARQDPQHDHDVEACAHVKTEEQRETFQLLAHERRDSMDIARHLDELEQAGHGTCH